MNYDARALQCGTLSRTDCAAGCQRDGKTHSACRRASVKSGLGYQASGRRRYVKDRVAEWLAAAAGSGADRTQSSVVFLCPHTPSPAPASKDVVSSVVVAAIVCITAAARNMTRSAGPYSRAICPSARAAQQAGGVVQELMKRAG